MLLTKVIFTLRTFIVRNLCQPIHGFGRSCDRRATVQTAKRNIFAGFLFVV